MGLLTDTPTYGLLNKATPVAPTFSPSSQPQTANSTPQISVAPLDTSKATFNTPQYSDKLATPTLTGPTTLSQGKKNLAETLKSSLPQSAEGKYPQTLSQGLGDVARGLIDVPGKVVETLGLSDEDKLTKMDRTAQALIQSGTDPTRAYDIATASVLRNSGDIQQSALASKQLASLKLTPQEQTANSHATLTNNFMTGLAVSNLVPGVGSLSSDIGKSILKIAETTDAKVIAEHLATVGVPKAKIPTLATTLTGVSKPEVVNDLIKGAMTEPKAGLLNKLVDPEIKRVSDNLSKNNLGITRRDAEAMAKDVIENRKFNQSNPLLEEAPIKYTSKDMGFGYAQNDGFVKNPENIAKAYDVSPNSVRQETIPLSSLKPEVGGKVNANGRSLETAAPPTVKIDSNGNYTILDGNHRIAGAQKAGYKNMPVWVVDESKGSLLQEAGKYKSVEEFVKGQPTYFHSTKAENVASIEKNGFSGKIGEMSGKSGGKMESGVFLYDTKPNADAFGKNFSSPATIETTVNGKVYDANTQTKYGWEDNLQTQEIAKDPKIIAQLRKDGYVGVKSTELGTPATFVFEPSAVQTKSQLTDIFNQAKGLAISEPKAVPINKSEQLSGQEISNQVPSTLEKQGLKESNVLNQEKVPSSLSKTLPRDFNPDKYVEEMTTKAEQAKTVEKTGIASKAKNFLADAKAKLVDFSAPIEDVLNKTVKENNLKLKPSEDIHNQIDRVLRAPTLAGRFAEDNGITEVIRKVDNPNALDQYLIAKHAIELDAKGIETGRNMAKDQALVKAFYPTYEPYAKVVSEYSQKLLDYSVDSGLISKDLADTLKARYPDYVPFQRVFNELEKTTQKGGAGGVASLSKQNIVQRIEGSSREIESPIESLLAKTNDAFKQGEKNKAAKLLASYKELPGNPFQLKELKPGETAPYTISFIDNGVKKTFATTKEVAQAAKSLNVQQLNILGKILAFPVRIARVGITGLNLPFIGANVAKDAVSAFINSTHGLKTSIANPENFVKALFSAVSHDDLYKEMVRAGGGGTSFDIARNQVEQTVGKIRAGKNIQSKVLYTVTHPSELLTTVEDIIGRGEEFTRIQQYRGVKESLIKEGMSNEEAVIGGARQAREATVNFARRGEWGTVLNSAFLYLNAGIQGTRTLLGALKSRPVATASKIAIAAMYPVAMATTWNLSDPKRREAYNDIADYEKQNNIIIVPPNPVKDADGKWNVIKIPLSQEINNLASVPRIAVEQAYGVNKVKFGDFASALIGTVSPINPTQGSVLSTLTPQAIKPTLEGAMNKNLFTGNPEVSMGLEKLSPENQVKPTTSKVAITLGKQLGISPIKIDAFIKETFGGVGQQLTGQQNVIDAVFARFGKASGGQQGEKAYQELNTATQQKADQSFKDKASIKPFYDQIQQLKKEGKDQEALNLYDTLGDKGKEVYKQLKTQETTKATSQGKQDLLPTYQKIRGLVESGKKQEAVDMYNGLNKDQQHYYQLLKTQFAKPKSGELLKPTSPTSQKPSFGSNLLSALGVETASAAEMPNEKKSIDDATSTVVSQSEHIAPMIDKNYIHALIKQESSGGTDDKNRTKDEGKYGWLVGFTKDTYKGIKNDAKKSDKYKNLLSAIPGFDTPEDAMKSALIYSQFLMRDHTKEQQTGKREFKNINAQQLYKLYNGNASPKGVIAFKEHFDSLK